RLIGARILGASTRIAARRLVVIPRVLVSTPGRLVRVPGFGRRGRRVRHLRHDQSPRLGFGSSHWLALFQVRQFPRSWEMNAVAGPGLTVDSDSGGGEADAEHQAAPRVWERGLASRGLCAPV